MFDVPLKPYQHLLNKHPLWHEHVAAHPNQLLIVVSQLSHFYK